MMIRGREIAARTIALVVGIVMMIGAISFGLYQCDQRRNEGAQSKVSTGQAGAAGESGRDAVDTTAGAGKREAGSEELTRSNERDIRGAEGAGDAVKPGVDAAGRSALCKREAYRNDPKCKGPAK
jgi:hypothetical protein